MKRILFTFGGAAYDETIERIVKYGPKFGADAVWVFDDRWLIETGFPHLNRWLWEAKPQHGFGHCSWKPIVWQYAMEFASHGDVLCYVDADTFPISSIAPLFDRARATGRLIFEEQGCLNRLYIKRDCFVAMGCDEERIHAGIHGCGRFQLFQKGNILNRQILNEWAAYSINPRCTLHDSSVISSDFPEFVRNSTEQAVLTVLAYKYGIPLHRTPDQNGWPISPGCGQPSDDYPQIFQQVWCSGNRLDTNGSRFSTVRNEVLA